VASRADLAAAHGLLPMVRCFGGRRHERYPLVAILARHQMLELLDGCYYSAPQGMKMGDRGASIAFTDDIRSLGSEVRSESI
jgi:hypothetical protein